MLLGARLEGIGSIKGLGAGRRASTMQKKSGGMKADKGLAGWHSCEYGKESSSVNCTS